MSLDHPSSGPDAAWVRIATHVTGGGTPTERAATDRWIAADPRRVAAFDALQQAWDAARARTTTRRTSRDLSAAWSAVALRAGLGARNHRPRARQQPFSIGVALAVGFAVMAMLPFMWSNVKPRITNDQRVTYTREYTTTQTQRAIVELPDGSRATLAPGTHLQYQESRDGARIVTLEGQAFFTVTHDPTRPYSVRSGAVTTRVLGTAFGVRRYGWERTVEVAVTSGKVASAGRGVPVAITPGMIGQIADSGATTLSAWDGDASTAWEQGRLVYTSVPLTDVLESLGHWYGYEFRLADSTLAKERVTTTIAVDGSSADVMRILEDLLQVQMKVEGRVVTLSSKSRTTRAQKSNTPKMSHPRDVYPIPFEVGK